MRMFFIGILAIRLLSLPILFSSGSSTSGPDWTITNSPFVLISETSNIVPYQFTEILDNISGLAKMSFNFTGGSFPQGQMKTVVRQTANMDNRVDAYEDLKIDLTVNLTNGSQTLAYGSYIEVFFLYRASKQINIKVYYWKSWETLCLGQTVALSGVQYNFKSVGTNQYVLEVCSQSPIFLNTVFDLADLNRYLLSLNLVRVWDARKNVSIIIQVSGAGELEFVQKAFFQERKQYLFKQETSFSDYYMANEPFLSNWSIIDFLNMSLPANGSTSGIISQAYLITPNTITKIYGHHWILIGAFFGDWKTPINTYGLPVSVQINVNLPISFCFKAIPTTIETGRAACFLLNFRDDFNSKTQSFSKSPSYLSRQIIITAWASKTYRDGINQYIIGVLSYYGTNWTVKARTNSSAYFFYAQTNLDLMENFDVFIFIRYLRDIHKSLLNSEYLVTIQTGFRYNTGHGKFVINKLQYKSQLNPFNDDEQAYEFPPPFSCYLLTNDSQICEKASSINEIIEDFLSIPMIGPLIKISPIISLVDEFTFYAYHKSIYDRGFRFIVKLCSEWTENKWVPSFLDGFAHWLGNVTAAVSRTAIDGQVVKQSNKFGLKNNFYENTSTFLLLSMPLNLLIFLILKGLEWLLRRFNILKPLQQALKPFRSFVCLFSVVLADNMTYLSFYCFLHLYKFVPYSHGDQTYLSCIICLLTLYAALVTAVCLGFAAWKFTRKTFEIDYFKVQNNRSYLFFSISVMGKFAAGFFHSYLDNPNYILLGLFSVNIIVFGILIYCWKAIEFKVDRSAYVFIYLGKVLLSLQLLLEIDITQVLIYLQQLASQNSLIIVGFIFGLMILTNIANKFKALIKIIKKKVIQNTIQTRKQHKNNNNQIEKRKYLTNIQEYDILKNIQNDERKNMNIKQNKCNATKSQPRLKKYKKLRKEVSRKEIKLQIKFTST